MATHSSILAGRIPMDRGAWHAVVHRVAESDTTEQTQAGWLSLLAEGSLLIPPPANSTSQPGGYEVLGDLFSEAVSTEQGPIPETHTHRGRENRMDKHDASTGLLSVCAAGLPCLSL